MFQVESQATFFLNEGAYSSRWRLLDYMAHLVRKRAGAGGNAPRGMVQGYFCNI